MFYGPCVVDNRPDCRQVGGPMGTLLRNFRYDLGGGRLYMASTVPWGRFPVTLKGEKR